MLPVWSALLTAFGVGVWRAGGTKRTVRALGAVIAVHGLWSFAWIWYPMSSRVDLAAAGGGPNDTGHLVLSAMTGIFAVAELTLAAASFDNRFRVFAAVTAVVMVASGRISRSSRSVALPVGEPRQPPGPASQRSCPAARNRTDIPVIDGSAFVTQPPSVQAGRRRGAIEYPTTIATGCGAHAA
jgi:hypothetical protein